jgi:hypothetical protein
MVNPPEEFGDAGPPPSSSDSEDGGDTPCALPLFADAFGYEDDAGPLRDEAEILGFHAVVGLLEAEILLPQCHSLKEKRGILAKTTNHLRKKHAVSVAEVAMQNTWDRAGLAVTTVSGSRTVVENMLRGVARTLERDREIQLVHWSMELM